MMICIFLCLFVDLFDAWFFSNISPCKFLVAFTSGCYQRTHLDFPRQHTYIAQSNRRISRLAAKGLRVHFDKF